IVASSGLSGSGLTSSGNFKRKLPPATAAKSSAEPAPAAAPVPIKHLVPMLIGSAIVIILLLGVVIGMLMKGGSNAADTGGNGGGAGANPQDHTPIVKNDTPIPLVIKDPAPEITVAPKTVTPPAPKVTGPAFLGVKLAEPT